VHDQLAIEDLFSAALESPKRDRRNLVKTSVLPESDKQAVLRLLRAHEQGSLLLNENIFTDLERIDAGFLDSLLGEEEQTNSLEPGATVGAYKVVNEIGRGGMSIVYKARQSDPIDRTVALKIIRPHLLSPQALRRFIREQQALAMVSHPNIATLYTVGTTDSGQPYAAMEFVNGVPIDIFCDKHRLSVDQRLTVFRQVCVALQHAHDHGVIHRDIKPSNILVFAERNSPRVKLIDFGIAKLLDCGSREDTNLTRFGQLVGSPRYMSPEQMGGHQIGTPSDVYAAGLVLFELVTGSPYHQSCDLLTISKSYSKENPELASDRIGDSIASGDSLGRFRSTTDRKLVRHVKRDINWILSKAIAPRVQDRYATVDELLMDVNCALTNQPISASRPTVVRRLKAFFQTNKLFFLGMFAAASLLLELAAFSHWYNRDRKPASTIYVQPIETSPEVAPQPERLQPERPPGSAVEVSVLLASPWVAKMAPVRWVETGSSPSVYSSPSVHSSPSVYESVDLRDGGPTSRWYPSALAESTESHCRRPGLAPDN